MTNRIAEARSMRGLSQSQLAKLMGTSQQQVARFERPDADVKSGVLVRASKALGVSVSYLLGISDEPTEPAPPSELIVSDTERYLIECYRACTDDRRRRLVEYARDCRALSEEREDASKRYKEAM